jgi:hypothetical protein
LWEGTGPDGKSSSSVPAEGMNPGQYQLSTAGGTLVWVVKADFWDEAMDLFLEKRLRWPPGSYTRSQQGREAPRDALG